VWANTVAAYETLPPVLCCLADQLSALHSNGYDYGAARPNATARQVQRYETVFKSTVYETEPPVVQVHPLTGERAMNLGSFVHSLLGVSSAQSTHLFAMLQDHVTRLENTVRYGDQARIVRRVTIHGPISVGIDGRHGKRLLSESQIPEIRVNTQSFPAIHVTDHGGGQGRPLAPARR
jgi:taurine dioxygenase